MTQPPQWGAHPPQGYPRHAYQQPWPGHLPPKPAPLVVLAILNWILAVVSLILATRPAGKQWIMAKHQLSLAQGHVSRNRR